MAELTRRCADCVTRFEGRVDKFTGDGIMALFGAPIAVEDHARRACYAGLEMQRSVAAYAAQLKQAEGIELGLRVGINSGEVIVGDIATADRFSYTAIGHTVGLAQRMESLAAPGSVYLSGNAARLAHGFLALRELGPHQVKGSSRPIEVFELVGLGTAGTSTSPQVVGCLGLSAGRPSCVSWGMRWPARTPVMGRWSG